MTKQIPLTQGKVALVDDDMYEYINQWKWRADFISGHWYAKRNGSRPAHEVIYMHRAVMQAPVGFYIDHINDLETLDNRRENLRVCTNSQNGHNRSKQKNNTTGYKGVFRHQNKFLAQITFQQQQIYIGVFEDPKEAAKAYDAKARELFGEFARTNF